MMSVPAFDFQPHNSMFLISPFHSNFFGGVLFGAFAGYPYWFPKFTGFKLNERLGKCAFWFWFSGFILAFFPLYLLGLMGATRRLNHYTVAEWHPLFIVASVGAFLILVGVIFQAYQLVYSIKHRNDNRVGGDPWDGRTLEWSTSSPPPFYNFAHTPEITDRDDFWEKKQRGESVVKSGGYQDIHMPKNTGHGFYVGVFSFFLGFALIWYMWWLAIVCSAGILVSLIVRLYEKETDYFVKSSEVEEIESRST